MKNHTQNVVEKLVPHRFIKTKKNSTSLDQCMTAIQFNFIVCPGGCLPKFIKTNLMTTSFDL